MFRTLRAKLLVALIGVNAVLAALVYLAASLSFDHGFKAYLLDQQRERLTPLVEALAEEHAARGGWEHLRHQPIAWRQFVFSALHAGERPLRRGLPPMHLTLHDVERRAVVGRWPRGEQPILVPIERDGRRLGYLGFLPHRDIAKALDRAFAAQQGHAFAIIATGMLLAAVLAAAVTAWIVTRPLRALGQGAQLLRDGNYAVRLEVPGRDELARLAADFNALAAALAAAQRARRQQIADLAHELRTPVAVLRAELEALEDGVRPLDAASVGSLAQEVRRLRHLIDDLHTLSLSDAGALPYRMERVDLAELLGETLDAQGAALARHRLALERELAGPAMVRGDAQRLEQLFANLLQNTLRYTDPDGRVRVAARADAEGVMVVWEDSAPGVSAADLPRLTERLYRVDGSRSRATGGAGLGLAIAQAVVEAHGGSLTPESSPLGGLRLTLRFPPEPAA